MEATNAECGVANPPVTWDAIFLWSIQNMKGKSLHVTTKNSVLLLQCTTCGFTGMLYFMGALPI